MPGLRGQQTESRNRDAVARRNSQNLARKIDFISASQVIGVNASGKLVLKLITNGGLSNSSGSLTVVVNDPVELTSAGVGLTQAFQKKVEQAGNTTVPIALAAMTQVAAEEAAEEAIVASATLSWMGI